MARLPAAIRLAAERDAAAIHAIYAPIVAGTLISAEYQPPSVDEVRARVVQHRDALPWLVCELDGELLGYAYAGPYRSRTAYQWCVEVTVYVHPARQRRGAGRALYASLFAILARQGYFNAYAVITLPNPASVGLHEALGFQPIGVFPKVAFKRGEWMDIGWWQLALQPHLEPAGPPHTLQALQSEPEWPGLLATGLPLLRV